MQPAVPEEPNSVRVLLIEDDPDVAPLVYRGLRKIAPALSIVWASDAQRAREMIWAKSFDVVIADYAIDGGGTGWTLLEEARAVDARVRCAVLSALPLGVDKLGTPFLRKPFAESELLAFLRPLLEQLPS